MGLEHFSGCGDGIVLGVCVLMGVWDHHPSSGEALPVVILCISLPDKISTKQSIVKLTKCLKVTESR